MLGAATWVKRWNLWGHQSEAVGWLLTSEMIVGIWAICSVANARYRPSDAMWFVVLAGCAVAYVVGTQEADERRRGRSKEHVDQTSVWLWTAAVVLPVTGALALLAVLRAFRWRVAARAPFRFTFTVTAQMASVLSVHTVATATGLDAELSGRWPRPHGNLDLHSVAAGAACIAAYTLAQHYVLLRPGRWLIAPRQTRGPWWCALAGQPGATKRILLTLLVAAGAAATMSANVWLVIAWVPALIHYTRLEQRAAQSAAEAEQLSHDALHDPLTGLFNRRGFDPQAQLVLTTAAQSALLMVDVDHFKKWNTRLGHLGADEVLQAITSALTRVCRGEPPTGKWGGAELVGRWGGEELVVIVPEADQATAITVAERIRREVAAIELDVTRSAGGRTVHVGGPSGCLGPTCTIGIALAPEHGTDLEELREVADQAMYEGKDAGRDRVVLAGTRQHTP